MATSLSEMFHVDFATEIVNRYAAASSSLLNLFGFQPGGYAELRQPGRTFGYDIVNRSRTPAGVTGPAQPATTVRKKVLGRVDGNMIQLSEKIPVLYEEIGMLRPLGADARRQAMRLEPYGEDKIRVQYSELGDRAAALRALALCGMLRGTLYGHAVGEYLIMTFDNTLSGADHNAVVTIDWDRPTTHESRLTNIQGAGTGAVLTDWANASADIPGQLDKINIGLNASRGGKLDLVICNSVTFNAVLQNTEVATQAGSSVTPFDRFEEVVGTDRDGRPLTIRRARLRCRPQYDWLIIDEYLDVGIPGSEASTKMIPDWYIWGGPNPSSQYFNMLVGSYLATERLGQTAVQRSGLRTWSMELADPPGREIHAKDLFFPSMKIPSCSVWGYVGS